MKVHLVDGTYELFRHHFALPSHLAGDQTEVAATRGVVGSMFQLLADGATHVGIATDHVIESFRNDLYPGYKTSAGMPPELLGQFGLLEDVLHAAGFCVWPMVEFEADDALAAAAAVAAADPAVEEVLICTPDKDLGQCVTADAKVIQYDRRKGVRTDYQGVVDKFGVPPESIPDYLALVGDSADGFPGLPGFGAKSAAAVLARWGHLEAIPADGAAWDANVRGAAKLAATLQSQFADAVLFRRIATVDRDAPTVATVAELRWAGPRPGFAEQCARIDAPHYVERAERLATRRA
jgi:5'-3' exonuclease